MNSINIQPKSPNVITLARGHHLRPKDQSLLTLCASFSPVSFEQNASAPFEVPRASFNVGPIFVHGLSTAAAAQADVKFHRQEFFSVALKQALTAIDQPPPVIMVACVPWQNWTELLLTEFLKTAATFGRCTYLLSLCEWNDKAWYSGPLGHLDSNGRLCSYLSAGGDAALTLPLASPAAEKKSCLQSEAVQLEGFVGHFAVRCLVAAVAARIDFLNGEISESGEIGENVDAGAWLVEDFSLKSAVLLVLLRIARGRKDFSLASREKVPPAWRRLAEHLSATWQPARSSIARSLNVLGDLIPTERLDLLGAVARQLNQHSAVIPDSLIKSWEDGTARERANQ